MPTKEVMYMHNPDEYQLVDLLHCVCFFSEELLR